MTLPKKCIATKSWLLLAALLGGGTAYADPIGVVSDLSGLLLVKSESGSIRVLGSNSPVQEGEVLATRKDTYAQLTLVDHTMVALGPDTELTVEKYAFHEGAPQGDGALLRLVRGRVRIATGLLGSRTTDTFTVVAPSATLDVRRSTSIVQYVEPTGAETAWSEVDSQTRRGSGSITRAYPTSGLYRAVGMRSFVTLVSAPLELSDSATRPDVPSSTITGARGQLRLAQIAPGAIPRAIPGAVPSAGPGGLAPGLYVKVIDGLIQLTNTGGSTNFSAGQFGYTASLVQPPVVVPKNPGLIFTPPPAFTSPPTVPGGSSSTTKTNAVDCVVR